MGWKESKVGRKRRKKVDFDLSLLEGKARRRGIGLTLVRSRSKKKRGAKAMRSQNTERAIRSHVTDITNVVLVGGKKPMKHFESPVVLAHEKKMKKHLDLAHPILLMCQNCGLEGPQGEWVKGGESRQSKPKLTCPRCGSSEHKEMD